MNDKNTLKLAIHRCLSVETKNLSYETLISILNKTRGLLQFKLGLVTMKLKFNVTRQVHDITKEQPLNLQENFVA